MLFPDQPHLKAIRKRLWLGRVYGQAAVMVGSGFSRNADPIFTRAPKFPLWKDLATELYNELYPAEPSPSDEVKQRRALAIAESGALRLAYEYEITFGPQAIETLIRRLIPDDKYRPGKLHRWLLELPWSDVFTTNYDTLLERTLEEPIIDRHYEIILSPEDLPGRMQPRIVKLHGSLPAHRPFIVTEGHYRTYPASAAPFVNTMQQSLVENAFVLLGFGGEDPNFLSWIGWVQDNLGEAAPTIYLCGVLDLTPSYRKLLERRGVTPIDLSPLFKPPPQPAYHDEDARRRLALEWLLLSLHNGRPRNVSRWPVTLSLPDRPRSAGLPPLLEPPPGLAPDDLPPLRKKEDLNQLIENWGRNRVLYPGWVIAPKGNRHTLWLHMYGLDTEAQISVIRNLLHELSPPKDLALLYELNWRLERAAVPLSKDWAEWIAGVLGKYAPFATEKEESGSVLSPLHEKEKNLDWSEIRTWYVELTFALAHRAREGGENEEYHQWMTHLEPHLHGQLEWRARWHHEQCLYHLYRAEYEAVIQTLGAWPKAEAAPFWEAKRAAVLAEMGLIKQAKETAEDALRRIRAAQRPDRTDYRLFSEESYTMHLLRLIAQSTLNREERRRTDTYRDRWDQLASYKCNPHVEIEVTGLELRAPPPKPPSPTTESVDTYTGRTSTVYTFRSYGIGDFRIAFAFLRFFDDAAVPFRCSRMSVYTGDVVRAAEWIIPVSLPWALGAMLRTSAVKDVKRVFDRVRLAAFSQEQAREHVGRYLRALHYAMTAAAAPAERERCVGVEDKSAS